jgi:hypothetical protein
VNDNVHTSQCEPLTFSSRTLSVIPLSPALPSF